MSDLSPLFGAPLQGYLDEVALTAGDTCHAMLSGAEPEAGEATASVRLVRLIHGDPSPQGPGYRDEAVSWAVPKTVQVREQPLDLGSYVEIPDSDSLNPAGAFSLAVWIHPTVLTGRWHTVAAKGAEGDFGYAVYCAGQNFVTAALSRDGRNVDWCTGGALLETRAWQLVVFTYDPDGGEACIYQSRAGAAEVPARNSKRLPGGRVHRSSAPLLFGASQDLRKGPRPHFGHFEGKIARPLLLGTALAAAEVESLARGESWEPGAVLGAWDLSLEVDGQRVVDTSPNHNDGRAVHMPARAVTGPAWDGNPESRYTERPFEHDAIHFHSDDLDDARWIPTFALAVPREARSGIYAAIVETERDRLFLPFVVRPAAPASEIAVLVPTLTWQAYSSNRLIYGHTEDGVLDPGVCIYNAHADGSMAYYCTRRKPTRSWHPSAGFPNWGAHALTADLYLVDWLETKGFGFDVFSDEHLHREGHALLERYRCLILSSHPEYWTLPMMLALHAYVRAGGRVLYLGGNGLYWVTSIDRERPFVMEVRKRSADVDIEPWTINSDGEYEHSTTLETGGLWRDRGIPARSILGVEYAANVFVDAAGMWGFERLPASWEERYAFLFEGVESRVIGDFGLNLGTAAAVEMDSTQPWAWHEDERPVALARASHELFAAPKSGTAPPVAELVLTTYRGGGAVFAAGSISWSGSLSQDGYENSVSRITENALRHFLRVPPGAPVVTL